MQDVIFRDLGNMGYQEAWDYQEKLLQENLRAKAEYRDKMNAVGVDAAGAAGVGGVAGREASVLGQDGPLTRHYLLFVEHPPVYTIGKSGHMENLLVNEEMLASRGVGLYRTNRGGDITFHGPEQIVGYPILDLELFYTDIGRYLRNIEEVIIRVLASYGIVGDRSAGETGVWIEPGVKGRERKICAIGVRCSRWVTMHGFAFNINTDLNYFNDIVPCGIVDKQVTSLEKELGRRVAMGEVRGRLRTAFEGVFGVRLVEGE